MTTRYTPPLLALMCASTALVGCGGGGGGSSTPTYNVTASVAGDVGGSISPASRTVDEGTSALFTVSADAASGYVIDTVTSSCGEPFTGGVGVTETTYSTGQVTAECTVEASFKLTHTVKASASTMGGAITPVSQTVLDGEKATFTVSPDTGFVVDTGAGGISGCAGALTGTTFTTDVVTGDCNVTGSFTLDTNAAPLVSLGYDVKQLTFDWEPVSGAAYYRLEKNATGASGYPQLGGNLTTNHGADDISVHLHDWVNASYQVEACDASDSCLILDTDKTTTLADAAKAIGYVKAPSPAADDYLGAAVALSGDGSTMAVGAPGRTWQDAATDVATIPGTVHIYTRSNGSWVHQTELPSPTGQVDDFDGGAVALNQDGTVLVVGAAQEDSADGTAADAGAVYVYRFDSAGGTWGAPQRLTGSKAASGHFGRAVSVTDSGNTLAVGAPGENIAYLFTDNGDGTWALSKTIDSGLTSVEWFGYAVALSGDGGTLAVGAPDENGGTVHLYSGASGWGESPSISAPFATGTFFGATVALSADGKTLVIGMPYGFGANNLSSGITYVTTDGGTTLSELAQPAADAGDRFGWSFALSADGNRLLVGAKAEASAEDGLDGSGTDDTATDGGAAYLFAFDGTNWDAGTYLKASNSGASDAFGFAVAMSDDGTTLAIGAPGEAGREGVICAKGDTACADAQTNNDKANAGAVYLY